MFRLLLIWDIVQKLNFRAPVINAYDSGRLNRLLADEGGKWPTEVPFSRFISIVTNTLVRGATRVGFCVPSTVNEMTKAGGEEYSIVWKNANQFRYKGKPTPNRFVTYFSPLSMALKDSLINTG